MRFTSLIWDFDGTLFDTYPPLIQAIARALGDFNAHEDRAVIADLLADTLATTIQALAERHALEFEAFDGRVTYYWRQVTVRDQPPMPGAIGLCERVLKAGGNNYIFTHRSRESLVELLDWYRVTGLFADLLTAGDGFPRKPQPDGFLALIERHALPPETVLAIGDRTLDVLAGCAAGVHTCLYNAPPAPDAPPDFVIAAFDDLLPILEL